MLSFLKPRKTPSRAQDAAASPGPDANRSARVTTPTRDTNEAKPQSTPTTGSKRGLWRHGSASKRKDDENSDPRSCSTPKANAQSSSVRMSDISWYTRASCYFEPLCGPSAHQTAYMLCVADLFFATPVHDSSYQEASRDAKASTRVASKLFPETLSKFGAQECRQGARFDISRHNSCR